MIIASAGIAIIETMEGCEDDEKMVSERLSLLITKANLCFIRPSEL